MTRIRPGDPDQYKGPDRRQYNRLPINTNIEYRMVNLGQNFQEESIREANIGGGGIYLPVKDPLPEGTMVEMKLDVPGLEDKVELIGKVVWSHGEEEPRGMGLEFFEIKPEVKKHIIRNARRGSWIQPELTNPDAGSAAL